MTDAEFDEILEEMVRKGLIKWDKARDEIELIEGDQEWLVRAIIASQQRSKTH